MNHISLIGRLTSVPELKYTQSNTAYTRFSIAVDRPVKQGEEKQADFINIVAWNQRAEMICKYFSKGQRIGITGSIRTGSYTAQDGTKRYTFEVWVDNVDFCDSKNSSSSSYSGNSYSNRQSYRQESASAPSYSNGSNDDFADNMPTDEDLPF